MRYKQRRFGKIHAEWETVTCKHKISSPTEYAPPYTSLHIQSVICFFIHSSMQKRLHAELNSMLSNDNFVAVLIYVCSCLLLFKSLLAAASDEFFLFVCIKMPVKSCAISFFVHSSSSSFSSSSALFVVIIIVLCSLPIYIFFNVFCLIQHWQKEYHMNSSTKDERALKESEDGYIYIYTHIIFIHKHN